MTTFLRLIPAYAILLLGMMLSSIAFAYEARSGTHVKISLMTMCKKQGLKYK